MPTSYDLSTRLTGPGLDKTWTFVCPSDAIETLIEKAAVELGAEFDADITVTKGAVGFNWAITVEGPEGLKESIDITQSASGLEEDLEQLLVGSGKTWAADAKITETVAPAE